METADRATGDHAAVFEAIVEQAPDAIIYADCSGAIRIWNRGAEKLFGYVADEVLGQSLDVIIPEQLRLAHWEGFRNAMDTGKTKFVDSADNPLQSQGRQPLVRGAQLRPDQGHNRRGRGRVRNRARRYGTPPGRRRCACACGRLGEESGPQHQSDRLNRDHLRALPRGADWHRRPGAMTALLALV